MLRALVMAFEPLHAPPQGLILSSGTPSSHLPLVPVLLLVLNSRACRCLYGPGKVRQSLYHCFQICKVADWSRINIR